MENKVALGWFMATTESWVKEFRYAIKTKIGSGWQVLNDRGNMRLLVGNKKEGFTSINLPFAWDKNQWPDAFDFIRIGSDAYLESDKKLPLKIAFKLTKQTDKEITLDWEGALVRYRKTTTRTIKEPTWKKKHLPVLEAVMFYMNKAKHKPQNSKTLHKKVLNEYVHGKDKQLEGWELGTTQRRHMRLAFNRFLDYCCNHEDFPSYWRPLDPLVAGERDDLIGNSKRIGYPLTDAQIGRLVDNFGEHDQAQRWRFAVQLCSVYGLRPEELNHLVLRNNKSELWCIYQKQNSNFKERQLFPLAVMDIDGKPFDWNYNLVQRLAAGEKLPEIPKGKGGQNLGEYLRRKSIRNIWKSICAEAEAEGLEAVPYSFRHRYAYVGHTRPLSNGTMRTVKQIADMMGHDPDTNLKSYARFQTKDLEKASDLALLS